MTDTRNVLGDPMTVGRLDRLVRQWEAAGRTHMILTVPRKRAPGRTGHVLPGVPCRYVGWENGRAVCDVAVADLRRYLDRHAPAPEAS